MLFNFYEWFFVEAVQSANKADILKTIKGDIESQNPQRYEQQLKALGGIYLQELGKQRRASTNDLNSSNFYELKNQYPLKFKDIFSSFYNERLRTPEAFIKFSRPYFYSAGTRMSPYLPMSLVTQLEARYQLPRKKAIEKLFSILIDINQKFQTDLQQIETEKISLQQPQPYRPVTAKQSPQSPSDSGMINISQITKGTR